ncbi:hypothetical protein M9Y10_007471 [Tritrichomonas musculus]|uniref:Right handed beta helix domain-containing protein n=1 Tax=Tritrichomonas musculus TaxID=1915356 RepID=A0ABR2J1U4_9EUKA
MFLILLLTLIRANKQKYGEEKAINESPLHTPEAIPISVRLDQMNPSSDVVCTSNNCPSGELKNGEYDLSSPNFNLCGIKCSTSEGRFSYTFEGVKFGIIGTKSPDLYSFNVRLDEEEAKEVYSHDTTLKEYSLLYVSEDLEDKSHTVHIEGIGEKYELYKLVYWPSLKAKRINTTEFDQINGNWHIESDNIGGVRKYCDQNQYKDLNLIEKTVSFSKVWVYGSKSSWFEPMTVSIGEIEEEIVTHTEGDRLDVILLYKSDEFVKDDYKIKFSSQGGDFTVNFIYYIENPSPSPTPRAIPIPVRLDQMTQNGDITCSSNNCPANKLNNVSYDLSSPAFNLCGIKCNTSEGKFSYTFEGVKFGIIGTASPDVYSFKVKHDDEAFETINTHKATRNGYSLLYVSEDLEYSTHTVNIEGTGSLYELYKLVYWPSLRAKRINSTEFLEISGIWNIESDNIGGVRKYCDQSSAQNLNLISTRIWTSHIWFYGSKCGWCETAYIKIGENDEIELQNQEGGENERFDMVKLHEESGLPLDYYNISFSSRGDATLNFIFYIEEPGPPPLPTPEAIPISVRLDQMNPSSDVVCTSNNCPSGELKNGEYDLSSPNFNLCGIKCSTSEGRFSYTFEGVKFGIIGTKSPVLYSFNVRLDGEEAKEVSSYDTTLKEYSLLYVSEDLEDKAHTVHIEGIGEKYELYKLVYWPSLKAKRINTTEFDQIKGIWHIESDNIGGVRKYCDQNQYKDLNLIEKTVSFSKVWVYGSKSSWFEPMTVSIGEIEEEIVTHTEGDRLDVILLYKSDEFVKDDYKIKFSSQGGDFTVNFIYYIENPSPSPTPRAIPIPVRLDQMTQNGDITCSSNNCPANKLNNVSYDLSSPAFNLCGIKCNTSEGKFSYTFEGVKFGIIGTASPDVYSFKVKHDDEAFETINTHKATRNGYSLLYVSEDLEYSTHTVNIEGTGSLYELYKLVYWPSLRAKRINSTEFLEISGIWNIESDNIGGVRKYCDQSSAQNLNLISTRIWTSHIWFYGSKCGWCEPAYIKIGENDEIELQIQEGGENERFDMVKLHETSDFDTNFYNVSFSSRGDATLNFIYYIQPQPVPPEEIIMNEEDCVDNKRCVHEEKMDKPINVYINLTTFENLINNEVNGNAIYIINAGLRCNKSTFTNCGTDERVGGAIYLENKLNYSTNSVILENLLFTGCHAKYGGAVYIYSSSNLNVVTIQHCKFYGNVATANETEEKYGGSALYLTVYQGLLIANRFRDNQGKDGSVKLINILVVNRNAMLLEKERSIVISQCSFDIKSDSDCSLSYVTGKDGSSVELNDSEFTGHLSEGSHYIKGVALDKDAPKLVVKNCKFAADFKKSIKMVKNNDFIKIDSKNQIFNYNINDSRNEPNKFNFMANNMVLGCALVLALALVALNIHLNKKQGDLNETEDPNDFTADSSLQSA